MVSEAAERRLHGDHRRGRERRRRQEAASDRRRLDAPRSRSLAGDPEVGFRKQMKKQGAVRSAAPTHPASKSSLPIVRSAHLRGESVASADASTSEPSRSPGHVAALAADLKAVWSAPPTDARLKKRIVRTVIHEG